MDKIYLEEYDYETTSPYLKISLLTAFVGFSLNVVASPMAFGDNALPQHLDTTVEALTIMPLIMAFFILILLVVILWLPQMDRHRLFWTKVGGAAAFIAGKLTCQIPIKG